MTADTEAERKLIVALDMPDAVQAYDFWQRLAIPNAVAKIGLELLMAGGVDLVRKLASSGASVFVDAKLFDIANTVERATARVADLGAAFLTVHAQDRQTVEAAMRGRAGSALKLLGITLLTNAKPEDLIESGDHALLGRSCASSRRFRGGCRIRWRGILGVGGARPPGNLRRQARSCVPRHPAEIRAGNCGGRSGADGDAG